LRRHLISEDAYSNGTAALIISRFTTVDLPQNQIQAHLSWICEHLNGGKATDFALSSLMICLSNVKNRDIFLELGGLQLLVNVCKTCPEAQTQRIYEACFCLWVLSFGNDFQTSEFGRSGAIDVLCGYAGSSKMASDAQKVIRVSIEALTNLVQVNSDGDFTDLMLSQPNDMLMVTTGLMERHWADYEVEESITTLRELLQKNFRVMTSFERYEKELRNGQLMFGSVHTEKFWRANCEKFKTKDFLLIRTLVAILRQTSSLYKKIRLRKPMIII